MLTTQTLITEAQIHTFQGLIDRNADHFKVSAISKSIEYVIFFSPFQILHIERAVVWQEAQV